MNFCLMPRRQPGLALVYRGVSGESKQGHLKEPNMSIRKSISGARSYLVALVLTGCLAQPAFSQGLTSVGGFAYDQSKAVLPGVEITITNDDTGFKREAITDEKGSYFLPQLTPADYTIVAKLAGFKTNRIRVALPVRDIVTVNLNLEVGEVSTVVDVVAPRDIPRVNAQIGNAFEGRTIPELPLPARNLVGLLALYPGVTLPERPGEFARDDGGQVNGARNDQQNTQQDGININQQEQGGALEAALPVTVESVQGLVIQTAGFGGSAGRGSGGQVQIVTRSGTNEWRGVVYDYYRTTGTSARNYFFKEATPLIRHLPGFAIGGPILQNKLLFFGTYEHHSDRSATQQIRSVPTPQFLNGIVRYRRNDGSFGVLTDGPGSALELFTGLAGDRWNPGLIGSTGAFEQYRPFSTDTGRTAPSSQDLGANILTYRFNAPFNRDRNVYITRIDYNYNSRNNLYFRGTLNDDERTLNSETFPGFNNASERIDNSKGFAVNWNSALTTSLNSSFSWGLTRESFEDTGLQAPNYIPTIFSTLFQTTGASRQAINTWPVSETLSWRNGRHVIQGGFEHRYIDNKLKSFAVAALPTYSGVANVTGNLTTGLRRALGDAEFNLVASPATVGDAALVGTGSISRFSEGVQFDLDRNLIPGGSPFERNFILKEWDFFVEDTFKLKPNVTLTYGLHYSLQSPPYERNGMQMNWTTDLGQRWREMADTTRTIGGFPLLATQLSGRANGLPDFYKTDTDNLAPRVSVAWAIDNGSSFFRSLLNKGGPLVIRAGYAMSYDRIGGRFARDAAVTGSVGLLTSFTTAPNAFSIDGLNSIPRAPRFGPAGELPRSSFPTISSPNLTLPSVSGGAGGFSSTGIDPQLHSPANHLLNFTVSKQLPRGWIVEGSYIGRFARDLLGQVDVASPPNIRDSVSGMTWYEATDQLFTTYLEKGAPVSAVQPIPWYENAYPEIKAFVEGKLQQTFTSVTQAWYAYLLQQTATGVPLTPGPNAPVGQIDRLIEIESGLARNKLLNPQVQFLGLFGNFAKSNYHSAQFTVQRRLGNAVNLTMNYTLSKSMDVTSAAEARGTRANGQTGEGLAADPIHPELSYALSDFDRRHQVSGYFVADLPFGTNKWIGRNSGSLVNQVIGGWQTSGIIVAGSGRPWNFTDSRFNHHVAGRDQPHMTAPIPFKLTKENGLVFMIPGSAADRAKISQQNFKNSHPGGAIARNQGRGPGFWNVDFAMTKSFDLSSVRENMRLRFRWEAFNVFNHPNFDIPLSTPSGGATNIDRSTQGQLETTLGSERVMQFGLRLEF
jgi:hypothetical protein